MNRDDLRLGVGAQPGQDLFLVGVVAGPVRLLADVDAVQRRLGDVDVPLADQLGHVAEEERQQQRRDVMAVGVGVHEQDDLAVAQAVDVELLAGAGADGGDQVGQLLVGQHLAERQPFGVEDLAAQRQHGLRRVVAALLGRAAGGIAFDDEQLRFVEVGRFAVGELAGQVEPALT